ncbi:MAG TPA: hemolysin family protein [Jiangellaceae bacterium]
MSVVLAIALGVLVVGIVTAGTGYFVAQEFSYVAADRNELRAGAAAGDAGSERALDITSRTSFMLSGAQLGITVTGLVAGYVAEPLIADGIAHLLGGIEVSEGLAFGISLAVALAFVTLVQMVFGELAPKNLAIARPEPVARWLARSTQVYLKIFGPVIRIFDQSATLLLRVVGIKPVQDVHRAATVSDLEWIVAASRTSGELSEELSMLLDRSLEFTEATAEHAMVPRPRVKAVESGETARAARKLMAAGYSRLPVYRNVVDDIVGMVDVRDLLTLDADELDRARVGKLAKPIVLIPAPLRLPDALARLREADAEFACVVDEYGGLAGVLTVEDIAEELVGEIADEHDPDLGIEPHHVSEGVWTVPGSLGVDEVERLIGHDLPSGNYESIGGLVIDSLGRFPDPGNEVVLDVGHSYDDEAIRVSIRVESVDRRVPHSVRIALTTDESPAPSQGANL